MGLYKIEIKPVTSFISKVTSNTLFGAFCFAIRDAYSEDILISVFNANSQGIVLSDLFPHGTLPSQDHAGMFENIKTKCLADITETNVVVTHRNKKNENEDSNTTWDESEIWSSISYDFYIQTDIFNRDDIELLTNIVLLNGLGKGRLRGKGNFELVGIDEITHIGTATDKYNGYMVLSDYIPKQDESASGIYTARVYQGAVSGVKKRPIYLINSGSTFLSNNVAGKVGVVGRLYKDTITNTYISGLALTIPMLI